MVIGEAVVVIEGRKRGRPKKYDTNIRKNQKKKEMRAEKKARVESLPTPDRKKEKAETCRVSRERQRDLRKRPRSDDEQDMDEEDV